jgi:hypothetical protein
VLEERARIARELHDVVAHHMSLMAIRAESAPHRLGALPDPVRAEFGALSEAAREALADMRRLPGLVETARQAGMTVERAGRYPGHRRGDDENPRQAHPGQARPP